MRLRRCSGLSPELLLWLLLPGCQVALAEEPQCPTDEAWILADPDAGTTAPKGAPDAGATQVEPGPGTGTVLPPEVVQTQQVVQRVDDLSQEVSALRWRLIQRRFSHLHQMAQVNNWAELKEPPVDPVLRDAYQEWRFIKENKVALRQGGPVLQLPQTALPPPAPLQGPTVLEISPAPLLAPAPAWITK